MNKQSDQNLINLLVIALFISLGAILFISSRYLDLVDKQTAYIMSVQPQNISPTKVSRPNPSSTEEISDWRKYKNEKFGFEIQFPESWQGYTATMSDLTDNSSVGFSFKEPHHPFTIFQINHYSRIQWNALKKNTLRKLIDQSDGSVLACDGCCSVNSDFTGAGQFDQFQIARCKEVPAILQSLRLTK